MAVDQLEAARREAAGRVEELRRQAPTSMRAHSALVHRDLENNRLVPAPHHELAISLLEQLEDFPFVCFVWPPGYGKSTFGSVVYPTWEIGRSGGRVHLGVVCNTATLAQSFAGAVMDAIRTPAFKAAYPNVRPDYERGWAKDAFYVTGTPPGPNPTMVATGIKGPVLGRRLTRIVLDDPTTWEDARSEIIMEAQRDWLRNTLVQRLPPGTRPPKPTRRGVARILALLTRWHERDLVPTLLDLGFVVVRLQAIAGDDDPLGRLPGEVLWPDVEGLETLVAMREGDELMFELLYQGNPEVLRGDIFSAEYWQRGQPPMRPNEMDKRASLDNVVQYVDTAAGKSRARGDYFCIVTYGVREGNFWVLDVFRDRLPTPEQRPQVVREAAEWKPDLIVIEDENEGRALYQELVLHERLPLKPFTPDEGLEWRAIPLANAYKAWRVWHPEDASWRRPFEAEMEAFPNGRNDDQVAAVVGCHLHASGGQRGMRIRSLGGGPG